MPTTPSPLSAQERGRILQRILFCPADERTARELHSMDSVERQQLWADMVGHEAAIQYRMNDAETPALLQDRMAQWQEHERAILQEEAEKELHSQEQLEQSQRQGCTPQHPPPADVSFAGVDGRVAYRLAYHQDPEWFHAQKLKFLRSEDFDVSLALNRMLRHLALKSYLFLDGNSNHDDRNTVGILGRDILLSDMSDDAMETLKSGGVQFLSRCDAAGRGIFFTRYRNYMHHDRKNVLRAYFYIIQHAVRNEQCQKVGFISVSYNVGGYPDGGYDFDLPRQINQLVRAVPVRFSAIYLCFDSSLWEPAAELVSQMVSPLLRVRLRSIQGSHQECMYQLYALGIPVSALPLNDEGENLLQRHVAWIDDEYQNEQRQEEASTT